MRILKLAVSFQQVVHLGRIEETGGATYHWLSSTPMKLHKNAQLTPLRR